VTADGAVDRCQFPIREIVDAVLRFDGRAFALAHNHTSADAVPARQTSRLLSSRLVRRGPSASGSSGTSSSDLRAGHKFHWARLVLAERRIERGRNESGQGLVRGGSCLDEAVDVVDRSHHRALSINGRKPDCEVEDGFDGHALTTNPEAFARRRDLKPSVRRSQIDRQPFSVQFGFVSLERRELV
jgi:hypothetical protein